MNEIQTTKIPEIAAVVIGRNEGERLRKCLESMLINISKIVYVDSGSTDGSRDLAKGLGVHVVELDMNIPFTAARARNEGVQYVNENFGPQIKYIQFVDGDCEIVPGWVEAAHHFLEGNDDFVVTCGRRREKFPEATIYNHLTDIEWNTPVGEALSCGGDCLMRLDAFNEAGGYHSDLIAGEEPELCVRLRANGGRVMRQDHEMTLHDAAITKFSQWWKRILRGGHAYAEGAHIHGKKEDRHCVKQTRRALFWGIALPCLILFMGIFSQLTLLAFAIYPLQAIRIGLKSGHQNYRLTYGMFMMFAKFAETLGILKFYKGLLFNKRSAIIEYK